jgi:DNA-binding MarR family transcriptional regulator
VAGAEQEQVVLQIEGMLSRMADLGRSTRYVARLLKLAEVPLQPSGWTIITVLNREGGLRVSQLAAALGVDQSTVSRQLKPLYAAGLVSRTEDPQDRRGAIVASTPAGQKVYGSVRRRWLDDLAWFIREWPDGDRQVLGELAERFSYEIDQGRAQLQRRDAEQGASAAAAGPPAARRRKESS